MQTTLSPRTLLIRTVTAGALLVLVMLLCSLIGPQAICWKAVMRGPADLAVPNPDYEIFVHFRVPRILLAALVGAALAGAGVVFQALLRNPLADPYILGISSGAGLGAMVAVIGGLSWTLRGRSPIEIGRASCRERV